MDRRFFDSIGDAEPFLGWLDSTLLISYALGLYISGVIGDRFDMRKMLSLGMCLSAVVAFVFGCLTEWVHLYSKPFYITMYVLFGLTQSMGWPCVVAIMGNWFGKLSQGLVWGVWSACPSIGNIIGALVVAQVLDYGYEYSLAYACLKMVNQSLFFWLPFYLHSQYGWKETVADEISIYYDVGGMIGGLVSGYVSAKMKKRAPTMVTMLLLALPSLWVYSVSPNNKTTNAALMTVAGFFIGGPANLISSAISADLGRQDLIKGNSEALSTVIGIVDGTGSVGASVGQVGLHTLHGRILLYCKLK
uniref:Major facilitator superfamily (MFS) profile domain-containing protein n=1 Tax=Branchiostoma floridae TaxID=7739 RepID=C3Y6M0_BRAFL|eukprot:XP_002607970.1 hypothetical protein BRAFLDRAFT_58218 [Branchiostoma floridae]